MARRKRIGRPPKAAEDRKAINFTFRGRPQLREQLGAAATVSGRSISEEIEYRLNQSFQKDLLAAAFRKDPTAAVAEALIGVLDSAVLKKLAEIVTAEQEIFDYAKPTEESSK